jgi:hypothetical protein
MALILIVLAYGPPRVTRARAFRRAREFLTGLIQADLGALRIIRLLLDVQDIFHLGDEGG